MDASLKAALAGSAPLLFGALKLELPEYTLRLLDGAGTLVISGETYLGQDPNFGTISTVSEISEEIGDEAPEITVTLYPPDVSATAYLANAEMQGSVATLMVGAVDRTSGLVIGTPETLFRGEIDVPTIGIDESGARTLEFTIVSVFELLFEMEEGQRATNGWLQSIWPGDLAFEFMTGTDVNLYWGAKPPKSSSTSKSSPSGVRGLRYRAEKYRTEGRFA